MEFRELKDFTKQIIQIATDEELLNLQLRLCVNPEAGVLIKGTGGARKIRMSIGNKGKSGGARAIYYWQDEDNVIWMLKVYSKNDKSDLKESEKSDLFEIISDIKRGFYE
jgi:hypothetical protein